MLVRTLTSRSPVSREVCVALLTVVCGATAAQRVQPQPVTDSSAQASPLTPILKTPVADGSAQASPISPERAGGPYIPAQSSLPISLDEAIDSGTLEQGQSLKAHLTGPVAVHGGGTLSTTTPVVLTVIETVPAGRIMAQGEFSLQVVRVGNISVYTNTLVFDGKPGHQDLPDSAPALGTDAGLPPGAPLTFKVLPPPAAADAAPADRSDGPGSVDGVASGGPPPPSAVKSTFDTGARGGSGAGSGNTPGQQQRSVNPGDTTTNQGTQNAGQPTTAPNQPQSPTTAQPH